VARQYARLKPDESNPNHLLAGKSLGAAITELVRQARFGGSVSLTQDRPYLTQAQVNITRPVAVLIFSIGPEGGFLADGDPNQFREARLAFGNDDHPRPIENIRFLDGNMLRRLMRNDPN
jgi:hypothetical protein